MNYLGDFTTSNTVYVPFHTFSSDDPAASITLTGLALADIKIYKDGSVTQRSSTSGFALLDTDGIDFDGITGIHGVSIDLSDNTDAGFFAPGSEYWIIVDNVTVDAGTVSFVAGTFSIERSGGALALLKGANGLSNIKTDTAAILVDTGTTLDGKLNTAQADLDTLTGTDGVTLATAQANYAPAKATDIVSNGAITTLSGAVVNVDTVDVCTTNTDMVAAAPTAAAIADAVCDEALSGHATAGTVGKAISDIEADTNELQTDDVPGLVAALNDISAADVWAAGTRTLTSTDGIKKNTAFSNFEFLMLDTSGDPATGLTVTAQRSIDGAAFAACANSVTELSDGIYKVDLAATDLNGDKITLKFTATGAQNRYISIITNT